MKKYFMLFVIILFCNSIYISAQTENLQIGTKVNEQRWALAAYYDFSEPDKINMKVSLWGFVRNPGRYVIPENTQLVEILSLAGGPLEDSDIDDIRIFRTFNDSSQKLIKIDYNQLVWDNKISEKIYNPELKPGDIIILPGSPKFYFKDYLFVTINILSVIVSIAIFIVTAN